MAEQDIQRILWIDDEPITLNVYMEELGERCEGRLRVTLFGGVDTAWQFFQQYKSELVGVILDIMMPPGRLFENDPRSKLGLRTGILFYDKIRELAPNLKVLILSNVSDEEIIDRFSNKERNCDFCSKTDYLSFEFAEKAVQFFQQ